MPLGKTGQKGSASPKPVLESSTPTAALSDVDMTEQKHESIVPASDRHALRKVSPANAFKVP